MVDTYAVGGVVTCDDGIGGVDRARAGAVSERILVPKEEVAGEVGLEDLRTGEMARGKDVDMSNPGC